MSKMMAAIYRALGGPWEIAADFGPDREIIATVTCKHETPVPWSAVGVPCGWAGKAVVSVWEDTKEALFWCPNEHENSLPFRDFE